MEERVGENTGRDRLVTVPARSKGDFAFRPNGSNSLARFADRCAMQSAPALANVLTILRDLRDRRPP